MRVFRVYLDQNKWLDLARAASGHPQGAPFRDALDVCRAAVAAGTASFPLDMYRYWETAKRGDDRSRNKLVDTMIELSRLDTVTLPFEVLDQEIDEALRRRFGVPLVTRRCRLFGRGMQHIAGNRIAWPVLKLPEDIELPPGVRSQLKGRLDDYVEAQLLRAGPAIHAKHGVDLRKSDHADRFVDYEVSLASRIAALGLVSGPRLNDALRYSDLRDIFPAVLTGLQRAGLDPEWLIKTLGQEGLFQFVDDLPTRYVTNLLRRGKHAQRQQRWEPNDFIDVVALPVPSVYCDAVVTEKQWVHHLRLGDVTERFGTQLLSDTSRLTNVLVTPSAS